MSINSNAVSLTGLRQEAEGQHAAADLLDFFVIDTAISFADVTAQRLSHAGNVLLMDPNDCPLETIAGVIEAIGGARSIHIVANGDANTLDLGGQAIDAAMLDQKAAVLERIGSALIDPDNIVLHGCYPPAKDSAAFLATLSGYVDVNNQSDMASA